ncbi:MAG: chorismate synthase [Candidatus Krumholzibacteria bacterium]|nr:chorismate synthase [Candidatus Krumholzibacteria bacterium]
MSSTFGKFFRVTTFGESHGGAVGAVIDGCPPRLELKATDIQAQLDRRRPGQSDLTTERQEADRIEILSGVENGLTLGTPIAVMARNKDQRPGDYNDLTDVPRPSHADFTYQEKYGIRAASGGGRASARETLARVAAGAIAEKMLLRDNGVEIVAWVSRVGTDEAGSVDPATVTRADVDANLVRCPDTAAAAAMTASITAARDEKDSLGGIVTCVCRNLPTGWGEPIFDKLEALLAHAMLSLPATKGFEIGSGFAGTKLRGSAHNDAFIAGTDGTLGTATNRSGGVQGGISNGEPVIFRIAFKPTATIGQAQKTADFSGQEQTLAAKGRHDPCVLPRAVPIVEAMAALVLADLALQQKARA